MLTIGNLSAESGQKVTGHLKFPTLSEKIPAFLIHGLQTGPTVLVMAGIHGGEYSSIDAALAVANALQPEDVKGSAVILPIVNPAAFYARSIYVHPSDKKNLNRVFPGKQDGSDAERLAYWLFHSIIEQMDAVIDLHGGDMIEALIPFTIFHESNNKSVDDQSAEMASLFGIDYAVRSTDEVPGSTYGIASESGIPSVLAEAGQQGIMDPNHSRTLMQGTLNVLRRLGVLDGEVEYPPCKVLDVFDWYSADIAGLWYPAVRIGEVVKQGQVIGRIADEFGETVLKYHATQQGIVLFLVTSLAMNAGDPLLALGY